MTKSEALIYEILDSIRPNIQPLACAVAAAAELLFENDIPMSEILITKDIYPVVAKQLKKNPKAISKAIERLAHLCWDTIVRKKEVPKYIGKPLKTIVPSEMVFYLAYYLRFGEPFYCVIQKDPAMLH